MAVRLRLLARSSAQLMLGRQLAVTFISVAVDKKTTLSELKSLVAEQDLIKTKSAMI